MTLDSLKTGEKIRLRRKGWTDIVLRWSKFYGCWQMLRYRDHYGEEHWDNLPDTVDVAGGIAEYRVPYDSKQEPEQPKGQLSLF